MNLREQELWNVKFCNSAKVLEHIYLEKDRLSATKQWKEQSSLQNVSDLAFGVWLELLDSFNSLKRFAFAILTIFGSTHIYVDLCEQAFS